MSTLVAIPVYNEQKYVNKVLEEVRHYTDDILVIDDGSSDQTPCLLARQPVDVIRHAHNRGYGRSIRDAFRWVNCYKYDWLITMDCDEQHEPASLPEFFEAIDRDDSDIISGSRYLKSDENGDRPPSDRREINGQVTQMINQTLDLSITDAFCGYKAYRVSMLEKLALNEDGYSMPLQLWVQAAANDLRISEIAIRLIYNDPNRSFGGPLDDPAHRIAHYQQTFDAELSKFPDRFSPVVASCGASGAVPGVVSGGGMCSCGHADAR